MTKTKSTPSAEPKPSGLNVKLLRRIQRAILKEPKRINMDAWGIDAGDYTSEYASVFLPPCQTVGCIAGWAVAIDKRGKNRLKNVKEISGRAIELLRLRSKPGELFYPWAGWPKEWCIRLAKESVGTPAYAQVVSDYIDYFIAKHEKETNANDNDNTKAKR